MKLQGLAVIFVLIILPISIVLSEYIQVQIDTLSVQTAYDSQLLSATYDAVVAFQKNTVNSWSSTITSSKIRDIEASANVFLTSIANNFKMSGNSKEAIKEYIPAIVYTLYDGYYIYSPFTNKIDGVVDSETYNGSYGNGERTFGLKPYIYYSREYENCPSPGDSFVITYSLDNYITIQGRINGNFVNEGGYIIDITGLPDDYDGSKYKGVDIIGNEVYKEYVDKDTEYPCAKVNGTKYYLDNDDNEENGPINGIFYFVQSERNYLTEESATIIRNYFNNDSNSAKEYYKNAYNFTKKVLGKGQDDFNLSGLKSSDAKDWPGYTDKSKKVDGEEGIKDTQAIYNIFTNTNVEYYNSGFNQERRAVIKYAIEKNLSSAIANFNNISNNPTTNFLMPKLSDDEWDKVINNVSVITFLQGINMGNRPYNGYAIVPNNKNEESVGEDSIFIVADDEYHRVNDNDLLEKSADKISIGVFNMNFERKAIDKFDGDGSTIERTYFYPRHEMACYNSIVSQTGVTPLNDNDGIPKTIYEYLDGIINNNSQQGAKIASVYYTALGRERNGLVKYGLKKSIEEYPESQTP